MKKVLVLGVGAQGSTVAKRLEEEPNVSEIVCADYDPKAVSELVKRLKKARGVQVDASSKDSILEAAKGMDLIVNALPLDFGPNVLAAALEAKTDYQDFAACEGIGQTWEEGIYIMLSQYSEKFKAIGKTAIIGTGSAPGLICVVARDTMKDIDQVDTIYMNIYEGVEARRAVPYWWSPVTALCDMSEDAYAFENGKHIRTTPFSRPVYRTYDYVGYEVEFVEHAHDEPVYMGCNADTHFKGAKNIYFKYGGVGIEFARDLYRLGLLSKEPEVINGREVVPFDVILAHVPPAPKYPEEIREILDEGLVSDTGATVVEAIGKRNGKDVRVESHVFSPGLVDSFKAYGVTAEQYITGQGGFLFTKLLVNDKMTQKGLLSSDMLTDEEVDTYLKWAAELGITVQRRIIEL